jgi:hypothetical protein
MTRIDTSLYVPDADYILDQLELVWDPILIYYLDLQWAGLTADQKLRYCKIHEDRYSDISWEGRVEELVKVWGHDDSGTK